MDVNFCCFGALQENLDGGDLMKKVMKKIALICCLFLLTLSLISCDPYSGQRPCDYGDAKWICEEYSIYFLVDTNADEYYLPLGKITIDNVEYICKFWFIHQTNQLFISVYANETVSPEMILGEIAGICTFSSDRLVLQIEKDNVLNGQYDVLTFIKLPLSEL